MTQHKIMGNPNLPDWKNIIVTETPDGKSFTVDNNDGLVWTFQKGANKYPSINQNGTEIVKDELWLLQVYDGSWKDIGSSVNVFYEQVTSYNVRVTQSYTSANGDYNVIWDFYGGFRPKITVVADIAIAGNYRIDWRTYVYKDYCQNMTNYVKFWNDVEEAVVFDYSDVYEAFGNITNVQGVDGWVKGKRFDLVFNVGVLSVGVFRLDPNFGYETKGATEYSPSSNMIMGTKYSCPGIGTATSITVYIKYNQASSKVRCAIYKASDNSLVGYTEEWTVPSAYSDWKILNIVSGGSLETADYFLVFWFGVIGSTVYYGASATRGHQSVTYNSFPNPWSPTKADSSWKFSIYCTYTTGEAPPAGGVLVQVM